MSMFTMPYPPAHALTPLAGILSNLSKVRKSGAGWLACCPAHPDKGPSLSLKEGDDGRVLLHCFAGCATADVVAAMGLPMADLFPPSNTPRKPPPAPGVSRADLAKATDFERTFLFILRCDAKRGRAISQTDMQRGQLARKRVLLAGSLL
jgi:CHC2 zinc finger